MKKLFKLSLVPFILLFVFSSCSDDQDEPIEIKQIQINELSSKFLFKGEVLAINGQNFINEHYPTKIKINEDIYDITPTSNTRIDLELIDDYGIETKDIRIIISDKQSNIKSFFIMQRDWYKITETPTRKIFLHEGYTEFTALGYSTQENQSNWGWVHRYEINENGYFTNQDIYLGNGISDLKMISKDVGVACGFNIQYTLDGFKTYTTYHDDYFSTWVSDWDKIIDVNENGFLIGDYKDKHYKSINQGDSYSTSTIEHPENNFNIHRRGIGSNGIYYEFGVMFQGTEANTNAFLVMTSPNGFDNWTLNYQEEPWISSSIYDHQISLNIVFYDYDLIYSINENRELIKSTDLTQTWQFVKSNVDAFFMKSETEWYMVSDDKLYHTTNSGNDWTFELDLPAGSTANDMDFTSNKIAIVGSNYIYLKHL